MYIFITSLVSIFFFILIKNKKLVLYSTLVWGILYTTFLRTFFRRLKLFPETQGFQVFFPRIYFLQDFFREILFPETLLAAPILFQEKKSQESSDIFSKDLRKFRLFSKVFISRFFFQKLFFPGLFYIDSLSTAIYKKIKLQSFNYHTGKFSSF